MLANSFFCENLQFGASLHHLSEIFIDDNNNMMCISLFSYGSPVVVRCMGFGWVWVGLGHGSISSPGSGLGWVVGYENGPMDNSAYITASRLTVVLHSLPLKM